MILSATPKAFAEIHESITHDIPPGSIPTIGLSFGSSFAPDGTTVHEPTSVTFGCYEASQVTNEPKYCIDGSRPVHLPEAIVDSLDHSIFYMGACETISNKGIILSDAMLLYSYFFDAAFDCDCLVRVAVTEAG